MLNIIIYINPQPRDGTEKGPSVLRKGGIVETLHGLGLDVCDYGDLPLDFSDKDAQYGKAKNPRTVGHASKMASFFFEWVRVGKNRFIHSSFCNKGVSILLLQIG